MVPRSDLDRLQAKLDLMVNRDELLAVEQVHFIHRSLHTQIIHRSGSLHTLLNRSLHTQFAAYIRVTGCSCTQRARGGRARGEEMRGVEKEVWEGEGESRSGGSCWPLDQEDGAQGDGATGRLTRETQRRELLAA